ncbi:MAG: T9SS type A sorting domain-containing protein [Ignavibacteria bacterium]|nr:T9SS type A sorting domain-containing protein [Ignavibacteria bacterium]
MLININKLKVILIVIFLFPFIHDSYSQRIKWEETFESEDIVSKGWRIVNRDSSDGTVTFFSPFEFFKLAQQNAYKGNYFLKLNFENANSKNVTDDWIITPKLYNIQENDSISFWCGAIDKVFKDSLKIYISETDNETGSFILKDYFKVDGPAGSWHKKSYDLSEFKGKNIYFAVNYYLLNAGPTGSSSDNVWIDYFALTGKGYGGTDVSSFELNQNFPNPFNPSTDISFSIPQNSDVIIRIYDITGKEVSILVNGFYQKGKYSLTFNGSNLASGVYFYKMTATGEAGEFTDTKKLELIK